MCIKYEEGCKGQVAVLRARQLEKGVSCSGSVVLKIPLEIQIVGEGRLHRGCRSPTAVLINNYIVPTNLYVKS